ncbi:MAG: ATP-grasp domain-containing protein [Muribaculaceae bacterium]|nr:ATP-grasp domain-containing protein [Muribaculaceae bacterium]
MKSFIFNPENDLALASGNKVYTPPRNALLLARCGALLPMWLAESGDTVIADKSGVENWIDNICVMFNLDVNVSNTAPSQSKGEPWGWSPAIVTKLTSAGINRSCLPDDITIERMRQISHRRTSIEINRQLSLLGITTPPLAVEASTSDEIAKAVNHFGGHFVMKSPWSSTGRGVFLSNTTNTETILKNAEGIIRRQGSVIIEPLLDRKTDFAMLFYAVNGKVEYRGLSLFDTVGTAYTGNLLLPESVLKQQVEQQLNEINLSSIANKLKTVLNDIIKNDYEGWLGVDMMVQNNGQLAPCIELNLRKTMGVVALILRDRFIAEGSTGRFMVEHGIFEPLNSAKIENNRLVDGEIDLVPPAQGFRIAMKVVSE